jgi:hypothetical protein
VAKAPSNRQLGYLKSLGSKPIGPTAAQEGFHLGTETGDGGRYVSVESLPLSRMMGNEP